MARTTKNTKQTIENTYHSGSMSKSCSSVIKSLEIFKPFKAHWSIIIHALWPLDIADFTQSILWDDPNVHQKPPKTCRFFIISAVGYDTIVCISSFWHRPRFSLPSIFSLQSTMFWYPRLAARWIASPVHNWFWQAVGVKFCGHFAQQQNGAKRQTTLFAGIW